MILIKESGLISLRKKSPCRNYIYRVIRKKREFVGQFPVSNVTWEPYYYVDDPGWDDPSEEDYHYSGRLAVRNSITNQEFEKIIDGDTDEYDYLTALKERSLKPFEKLWIKGKFSPARPFFTIYNEILNFKFLRHKPICPESIPKYLIPKNGENNK